ncbi:MAG: hypothetical protein M1343_08355 [Chloroflexi bacterium]|nr:hypothetical protein [Chloroflexota bacterium]
MGIIKYIDIKEFVDFGFLQEVNRQFLHPLGLALEVAVNDDGSMALGGIWDYQDDPEGMAFADEALANPAFKEKAERVRQFRMQKAETRLPALGYVVQPVDIGSFVVEDSMPD